MSNVSEIGAQAFMSAQDINRRLPEVKFSAGEIYVRSFLKIACKQGQTVTQADAEFIHDEYPSSVLIGELIGEPVYSQIIPNRQQGLQYPIDRTADEILNCIVKKALNMPTDFELEGLTQEHQMNLLSALKTVQEKTRPELKSVNVEDYLNGTLKSIAESDYKLISKVIHEIIVDFSNTRTDIRSWTAPYQTVTFSKSKGNFFRGSITPREADNGVEYGICNQLGYLMTAYSKELWKNTESGKKFINDMDSPEARNAWSRWCMSKGDTVKLVWGTPNQGIVHFCISGCTDPKYASLKTDPDTKKADPYRGYFKGSLGTGGKTHKILSTAKTGRINDDPDYFTVVLNYTSSTDQAEAGRNMNVQPLADAGDTLMQQLPTIQDIHEFIDTLIIDKKHSKVRLYDEFNLQDNILRLRDYVIKNNVVDVLPDITPYQDTLKNILGIDTATSFEELAQSVTNTPIESTTNPINPAMTNVPSTPVFPQAQPVAQSVAPAGDAMASIMGAAQASMSQPNPIPTPQIQPVAQSVTPQMGLGQMPQEQVQVPQTPPLDIPAPVEEPSAVGDINAIMAGAMGAINPVTPTDV